MKTLSNKQENKLSNISFIDLISSITNGNEKSFFDNYNDDDFDASGSMCLA